MIFASAVLAAVLATNTPDLDTATYLPDGAVSATADLAVADVPDALAVSPRGNLGDLSTWDCVGLIGGLGAIGYVCYQDWGHGERRPQPVAETSGFVAFGLGLGWLVGRKILKNQPRVRATKRMAPHVYIM
jgi:hypothetical protein